jgi:hypothetical protein
VWSLSINCDLTYSGFVPFVSEIFIGFVLTPIDQLMASKNAKIAKI